MSQKPLTYADAGVSIDAGNALVKAIGPLATGSQGSFVTPISQASVNLSFTH